LKVVEGVVGVVVVMEKIPGQLMGNWMEHRTM
jgi:hypothetical protein